MRPIVDPFGGKTDGKGPGAFGSGPFGTGPQFTGPGPVADMTKINAAERASMTNNGGQGGWAGWGTDVFGNSGSRTGGFGSSGSAWGGIGPNEIGNVTGPTTQTGYGSDPFWGNIDPNLVPAGVQGSGWNFGGGAAGGWAGGGLINPLTGQPFRINQRR